MREAADLLRLNMGEALRWVEDGQLHAVFRKKRKQLGGARQAMVTWNDLASAALLRWNVMQVHEALGAEANRVLPRLLRPVEMKSLRLPEYLVRLLETLAQDEGVSLDEYVFTMLMDLESYADPDEMERLLPGFKEAIQFPDV
jgi:hypothetical protein